jgi:hypothetical protein
MRSPQLSKPSSENGQLTLADAAKHRAQRVGTASVVRLPAVSLCRECDQSAPLPGWRTCRDCWTVNRRRHAQSVEWERAAA